LQFIFQKSPVEYNQDAVTGHQHGQDCDELFVRDASLFFEGDALFSHPAVAGIWSDGEARADCFENIVGVELASEDEAVDDDARE